MGRPHHYLPSRKIAAKCGPNKRKKRKSSILKATPGTHIYEQHCATHDACCFKLDIIPAKIHLKCCLSVVAQKIQNVYRGLFSSNIDRVVQPTVGDRINPFTRPL